MLRYSATYQGATDTDPRPAVEVMVKSSGECRMTLEIVLRCLILARRVASRNPLSVLMNAPASLREISCPAKWAWIRLANGSVSLRARSENWAEPSVTAWAVARVLVADTG